MNAVQINEPEDARMETNLFSPNAFVWRCSECGTRLITGERPGSNDRQCSDCDRLAGVRPVRTDKEVPQ